MDNKLHIVLCSNYIKEAEYVIQSEGLKDIVIDSYPDDCMNCMATNKNKISDMFNDQQFDKTNTRLLSCSIFKNQSNGKNSDSNHQFPLCQSMLAGETLVNSFIKQEFYILTPGWLMNWEKYVIDLWGFDSTNAKSFFNEAKKLTLLDSCLYGNIDKQLDEFAEFISLQYSIIPVGIDYFKSNLLNIYLKWKNENMKRYVQEKSTQIADFALVFELLSEISQLMETEELLYKMLDIFVMFTGASKVAYLSILDGSKEKVFMYRNIVYESELNQLDFDDSFDEYRLTKSGRGFILKIKLSEKVFDYLEVDDIVLVDRIQEYISLSITIFKICSLLISKSRIFYDMVKSKIETEEESKAVSIFLANMSHELRTPINVILSGIQLFERSINGSLNDYYFNNSHLKAMKQNCLRLLRIVNNLIDITKIETNFMNLDIRNEDIVCLVEDITLSVAEYAKGKDIYVEFDTDIEEKIIPLDADKIERIFLNLLGNAIKFTKEGGCIFVNIYDKGNNVGISVKDTGIGIPSTKINRIFDRFMQVEDSFIKNQEGSGIGLSIVKSFVEMHNGNITVSSEMGVGSEFLIEFPIDITYQECQQNYAKQKSNKNYVEMLNVEFSDIYLES